MKLPFLIAHRYIKSDKGKKFLSLISVITIFGIALGVSVLIIAISILNGFESTVAQNIIKFNAHINISGHSSKSLKDFDLIQEKLTQKLHGTFSDIAPYISKKVIISKGQYAEGIILNGIDDEYAENSLNRILVQGKVNFNTNPNEIIVGKKLADKFGVSVGDNLVILALNNDEPPSLNNLPIADQFKIGAIYESGMAEYDDIYAYIPFRTANSLFELDDEVTGYNINLNDPSKIDSIKTELNHILSYPFYVRSYKDINRHIFTWLELQQKPIPIVLGLIIIVAIFNIVGAVLMLVIQKTSAIGVLRSLGANNKQILQIFLFQGIAIAAIGIILGNLFALSLSLIQNQYKIISLPEQIYYLSSVPITINFWTYLIISLIGLFISVIVSLIPSYIASRIKPITAIKFN